MNKDLDIQIKEALKAYLASGVEDQVDYHKFYLYSIVTHSTAYQENDTVNLQTDTVSDTVNSQNDTVNKLKEGLKRIYIAIQKNPEITHSQLMEIFNISESTAKRATRDLKKLGYIEREGSDKTGRWVILK